MQKLPEDFEKQFFDLLVPVSTEGTNKNRRNLMVASFIIIAIYLLGKSVSELKVLGLSLEGGNASTILIVAFLLILFWLVMFIAHTKKDAEINKERRHLLDENVIKLKESVDAFQKYKDLENNHPNKRTMKSIEYQYSIYTKQLNRTNFARLITSIIFVVENSLPIFLSLIALYFIGKDILHAW